MLTENEKHWLETRGKELMICRNCWRLRKNQPCYNKVLEVMNIVDEDKFIGEGCLDFSMFNLEPDYKDAAEFESRVARQLTRMPEDEIYPSPCIFGNSRLCSLDCTEMDCRDARLKWARLQAEEEMEKRK